MKTNWFLLSVFTIAASFLSFAVPRTAHASPSPKPAEAKTRVAIIGLDHDHVWGLLKDLAAEPDAELVGIADAHAELVNRAKTRAPANVKFYSDYIQMLDDAKPDAVIVTTENDLHLAILRECAKGKWGRYKKSSFSTVTKVRRKSASRNILLSGCTIPGRTAAGPSWISAATERNGRCGSRAARREFLQRRKNSRSSSTTMWTTIPPSSSITPTLPRSSRLPGIGPIAWGRCRYSVPKAACSLLATNYSSALQMKAEQRPGWKASASRSIPSRERRAIQFPILLIAFATTNRSKIRFQRS